MGADTERISAYYDEIAEPFLASRESSRGRLFNDVIEWPSLERLLGPVEGKRVLDMGCGPGIYAERLAKRGASVTGVDLSPVMVDKARQRCTGLDVALIVGDALKQVHSPAFDIVLASFMPGYVSHLGGLSAHAADVLHQGGVFVVSMIHPMRAASLRQLRRDAYIVPDYFGTRLYESQILDAGHTFTIYVHRIPELVSAATGAGLRLREIEEPCPPVELDLGDEEILYRNPSLVTASFQRDK